MRRTSSSWRRPRIGSQSRRPVRTVRTKRSAWALACGARLGVWIHLDLFAGEDFLEGGAEFAVAVVDQEPRPREDTGEAEVACLLADPGPGRVARATSEVDAAAAKLDEQQHGVAAKRNRLDSEEILLPGSRTPTTPRIARCCGRYGAT